MKPTALFFCQSIDLNNKLIWLLIKELIYLHRGHFQFPVVAFSYNIVCCPLPNPGHWTFHSHHTNCENWFFSYLSIYLLYLFIYFVLNHKNKWRCVACVVIMLGIDLEALGRIALKMEGIKTIDIMSFKQMNLWMVPKSTLSC